VDILDRINSDSEACGPDLSDSYSDSVDGQIVNVGDNGRCGYSQQNDGNEIGSLGAIMKVMCTWQLFVPYLVINHLEADKCPSLRTNVLCYILMQFYLKNG
jgi:hypothetical protein